MTDNQIVMLMERCYNKKEAVVITQFNSDNTKTTITLDDILGVIYRLQKNYESLKGAEEREHQYCKNVCEPKYKAEIADEKAKGDICAAVIARQDKEIECYRTKIKRFEKIETAVNDLWGEIQKLATFKNKRKPTLEELLEYMENLKDEAIKEFAARLKSKAYLENGVTGFQEMVVDVRDIDETCDEMVGEG